MIAARQLVADAHDGPAPLPRRRRPRRKTPRARRGGRGRHRRGLDDGRRRGPGRPPGDAGRPGHDDGPAANGRRVEGIALVAAEAVTFPLSLDPAPEGLTAARSAGTEEPPTTRDRPLVFTADYLSADQADGFMLWLTR